MDDDYFRKWSRDGPAPYFLIQTEYLQEVGMEAHL